ncbi:MAG: hypothetical protein HQ536_01810 [Parcubacteria group bacterium]|nr:hypothetical protein [Parcubacteria group bacterium]
MKKVLVVLTLVVAVVAIFVGIYLYRSQVRVERNYDNVEIRKFYPGFSSRLFTYQVFLPNHEEYGTAEGVMIVVDGGESVLACIGHNGDVSYVFFYGGRYLCGESRSRHICNNAQSIWEIYSDELNLDERVNEILSSPPPLNLPSVDGFAR